MLYRSPSRRGEQGGIGGWKMPPPFGAWIDDPRATIIRVVTGPEQAPLAAGYRCEQRLRRRRIRKFLPPIQQQQPVAIAVPEESHDHGLGTQHGAVKTIAPLCGNHRVFPADP